MTAVTGVTGSTRGAPWVIYASGRPWGASFRGLGPGEDHMTPIIKILGNRPTADMRLSGVGCPVPPPAKKKIPREK